MISLMLQIALTVAAASDLPRLDLILDGDADITSREDFVTGTLRVDANGHDPAWTTVARTRARGRGNSTWNMPKRPFKLVLDEPRALLGMPADRDWSLLANYADKSLMRNMLANYLGRKLDGLDFVPRDRAVRLTINGQDLGIYVLSEDVKVAPQRLSLDDRDVTGGYLLELDRWMSQNAFVTPREVPYAIVEPARPDPARRAYVQEYVEAAENALYGADFADPERGYRRFLDVPSFVDWYLVNEILKNSDAANYSSIYLHKNAGQPLRMGPIWDFDLAAGNTDYDDTRWPEGWWLRSESPWYRRLFADPKFAAAVGARWRALADLGADLPALIAFIDQTAASLEVAAKSNFVTWDILGLYVWPNAVVTGSYAGEVAYLKDWLTRRMRWIDSQVRTDDEHDHGLGPALVPARPAGAR